MILSSNEKNILFSDGTGRFSTSTCRRCGQPLTEKDDDVMKTCGNCKCIK